VPSLEEQRKTELEFRELISAALEERWKKEGRYSAKDILEDIRSNEKLWRAMAEQLAHRAATTLIRRRMASRDPGIDPAQERFPFAKDLPVPTIMYKGSVVSTLRCTAAEYLWFSNWYEHRHTGTVKRSRHDKKTLARVQRFARIVEKYRGDDPDASMEKVFRLRQEKLEALRKQRKNRKGSGR
jgi:hypothetical protein